MIIMEIEKHPELIQVIRKMKDMGYGLRKIAAELETNYQFKTTHQSIKNFIDAGGLMEGAEKFSEARDVLGLLKQLKQINKKMWEIFEDIHVDKDKLGYARANILNKLLQQLDFQKKLLERITSGTVTQKISYLEFSVKVSKYLEVLEKEGYIKIIKRPLKVYDD